MSVSVITAPLLDPGQGRFEVTMPEGLTLLEMVEQALPGMPEAGYDYVRVSLVTPEGVSIINGRFWGCTRPRDGVQVVIRVVPGKDALRSILTIVISVASLAFAPAVAGFLGITSELGISLVAAGLNVVGMLLLNALIPVPSTDDVSRKNTYLISGLQNTLRRDEPVPLVLGKRRFAPPFGAMSYTEIVGDQQYVRALFCFGYGRLKLGDFKLGDTPLADYSDVDIEVREGVEADLPITLVSKQVLQDDTNIELARPLPRDAAGEIIYGGESVETPIRKSTAVDTETVSVILAFQGGLFAVNDKGRLYHATVQIRIRQRLIGAVDWIDVTTLSISAKERSSIFRQHTWKLPSRGQWQIEVMRMTPESSTTQISDRSTLAAIQSIRPEYPINFDKPMALVALRIRASYQLNGMLDNFNAMATRMAEDWNAAVWMPRNPATSFLQALMGPSNPFPVSSSEIDFDLVSDWHEFCATKGLKYDDVHGSSETLTDMLQKICAAGRATPRQDGVKWGVVIDRPDDLVIDHVNPRNSDEFKWSRQYFDPPHAFRIKFDDETNGYGPAERIVPWPGHSGDITLTEALNLPGKTDPDEIWIEARRRMYELLHRSDSYTAIQDGAVRVATRGDTVMGSFDVLDKSQMAARVTAIEGALVALDDVLMIKPDVDYAIRFRAFVDSADTIGISVVCPVTGQIGENRSLVMQKAEPAPQIGDLVHFGEKSTESVALKVKGVEAGENLSSILNMVAAAPEIDILADAETPPSWNGRVGAEIALAAAAPAEPVFTLVATGISGTGHADHLKVLLRARATSAAPVTQFRIEHRLAAVPPWVSLIVPVADGGTLIEVYVRDDSVELRAVAITADGTEGPYTPVVNTLIGSDDAPIPVALDAGSIVVTGGLGATSVSAAIGTIDPPDKIQLYRAPGGVALDRELHAVGALFGVSPGTTAGYIDGDATRSTLMENGGFASVADWATDANWTISDGKASHFTGVADNIEQADGFVIGQHYRCAFTVSGRTTGSVTPRLSGGTNRDGAAVNANGPALDRIQAASGNTTFALVASSDFDGSIDDVVVFAETPACVAQGAYDYYLEAQNQDNIPGPVTGPFSVNII